MYYQHQMGDLGRNIFTPLVHTVKRVGKVVRTPVTVVRKVTQGNIKGATKDLIDLHNPIVLATKALSDKENIVNMARLTSPVSVVNISDRKLRKKAAIGYAAAAVVATGVFAVTAAEAGAAGAGAATATTGAAGAIGTATKVLDIGGRVASLAGKKKQPGEEGYEEEQLANEQPKYLAGMITPQNILLFVGLSALSAAGYLLFNKPK